MSITFSEDTSALVEVEAAAASVSVNLESISNLFWTETAGIAACIFNGLDSLVCFLFYSSKRNGLA